MRHFFASNLPPPIKGDEVRARCGRFIEILLHASEENRTMVAIMFQRKLVREFICECGKKLAHRDLDSPPNEYTDCTTAWDTIRRIRPFQVRCVFLLADRQGCRK